ncbi:MAG: winged helix-turn-helix transcriptional regulator [Thermoplasmata archaeon]|nr:MAG: winged helix-turn-helix transcriptional regulator [Thermoplasmata archaeon]
MLNLKLSHIIGLALVILITFSTFLSGVSEIDDEDERDFGSVTSVEKYDDLINLDDQGIVDIPFLIIPLYHKTPANLFLNQTRENIYDIISRNPGITFGTITRELRLAAGECQYHVRVLEREGYIKSKRTGKYTRYYLTGQKASEVSKIQEQILLAIKDKEGLSQTQIASILGISRQVVNYNIKPLVKKGEVIEVREINRCRYFIAD